MPRKLTEEEKKIVVEVAKCSSNFWEFYKHCKTYDVNAKKDENPIKPAPRWKYLERFYKILETENRIVIHKTRQLFFTTFLILWVLWLLLFSRKPLQIIVMSESLKKAYDGTKASMMGRLEFAHTHLPAFLKQKIEIRRHPQVIFENKRNGVTVVASATSDTTGRSESYDIAIIDEYAWHEQHIAKDLPSSLSVNVNKLIILSTPRGKNHFYDLIQNILNKVIDFCYAKFFWEDCVDEPERRELYEKMSASMLPKDREREMRGSFEDSQEGKVFDFIRADHEVREPIPAIDVLLRYSIVGGMDVGIGDNTALILGYIKDGKCYIFYGAYRNGMLPKAFEGMVIDDLMKLLDAPEDKVKQLLQQAQIYVDSYAENQSNTHDTTLATEYRKLSFKKLIPMPKLSVKDGIYSMHMCLKDKIFFEHVTEGESIIEHLYMTHYPIGRTGAITDYEHYEHDSPNFCSDYVDSARYLMISLHRKFGQQGFEQDRVVKKSRISEIQQHFVKQRGGYSL